MELSASHSVMELSIVPIGAQNRLGIIVTAIGLTNTTTTVNATAILMLFGQRMLPVPLYCHNWSSELVWLKE